MLFPNHTEEELKRILAEADFDLDNAISAIIGQDNLANAPSATELLDDEFQQSGELLGEPGSNLLTL